MSVQAVRDEIADILSTVAQTYSYLPGAAQIPSITVALPTRIDHTVTANYWRLDLPVVIVTRSADPHSGETALLELVTATVATLKANRTGDTFAALRVVESLDFFPITVGTIEAQSATVNIEVMIPTPT